MSAGCPVVNVSQSLVLPLASSSCTSCLCGGHRKVEKQRSLRLKMDWSRKYYDDKCMLPITLECCRNEIPLRSGYAPITLTIIVEYFRNDLPTTIPSRSCHAPFFGRTTSRGRKQKQGGFQPTHQMKGAHFAQHELILTHLLAHNHSTGCTSIAGRNKRKKNREAKSAEA